MSGGSTTGFVDLLTANAAFCGRMSDETRVTNLFPAIDAYAIGAGCKARFGREDILQFGCIAHHVRVGDVGQHRRQRFVTRIGGAGQQFLITVRAHPPQSRAYFLAHYRLAFFEQSRDMFNLAAC